MKNNNRKKLFTLIFVPHGGNKPFNYNLSFTFIKIACLVLITTIGFLGYFGLDYLEMQGKVDKLERLKIVNDMQSSQLKYYAEEFNDLKIKFHEIEEMDRDIRNLLEFEEFDLSQAEFTSKNISFYSNSPAVGGESQRIEGEVEAVASLNGTLGKLESLKREISPTRASLEELESLIKEEKKRLSGTPSIWPTQGRITSSYGHRRHPISNRVVFHNGIDIGADRGTPVYATADGVVASTGYNGGMGRTVIIDHPFGHSTLYAHLTSYIVERGDEVEKGETIGHVGNTGYSTGPHLHYEVHKDGETTHPKNYLPEDA